MKQQLSKMNFLVLAIIILCGFSAQIKAQTTTYTYQGKLNDASVASPTNGTYEI